MAEQIDERAEASRLAEDVRIMICKADDPTTAAGHPDPRRVQESNAREQEDKVWTSVGAIEPPYDPASLVRLFEHSNALRQNVDAYGANIEAFGSRFEPVVDLDAADAREQVADALFQHRQFEAGPARRAAEPTDEEIDAALEEMALDMRREKAALGTFFEFCSMETSFVELRKRTRQDVETTGNGYWEVLRNGLGRVAQFVYLPTHTMRLLPQDSTATEFDQVVRVSALHHAKVKVRRKFRRFCQVWNGVEVFFKEFGDPRVLGARSGKFYLSRDAMKAEDETQVEATEVFHFKIHSSRSPYGVPRWMGALLAVLGSRYSEEVNLLYFDNKSVPPLAVLVSGGRVSKDAVERIKTFVQQQVKGRSNFHSILIIDAESAGGADFANSGRMKIDLKPLTGSQHSDGLFQAYDERNMDKVGMTFRLPRMLRGDVRDFNRATAEAALSFAETQVFSPERENFDHWMNRWVLSDLGVRYWRFRSNAPTLRDPTALSATIAQLCAAGVLTPEEARALAEGVFNREFKRLSAEWTQQPITLTLAGIQTGGDGGMLGLEPPAGAEYPGADGAPALPEEKPIPALPAKPGEPPPTAAKRRALRLAAPARLEKSRMRRAAVQLIRFRGVLLDEERRAAADDFLKAKRAAGE
jgi:PBSX family phage portal protein